MTHRHLTDILLAFMVTATTAHLGTAATETWGANEDQTDPWATVGAPESPGQPSAGRTGKSTRTPCSITGMVQSFPASILVNTTDDLNTMSGYPACNAWDESGPEEVYELTVPDEGPYVVFAHIENAPGVDHDVFILGAPCDSDNCLAAGSVTASVAGVPSGTTLFVSIDGFGGSSGAGTLTIDVWVDPLIFSDDFESGMTSNWSNVVP